MPKTEASIRAVPLQTVALAALERLPADGRSPLLFPAPSGGHFDLHNFRNRVWFTGTPEQDVAPMPRG